MKHTKYQHKIQKPSTDTKYKIQVQTQNTNTKYKIQTQKTTHKIQHTKNNTKNTTQNIQIQNTNTKYKHKIHRCERVESLKSNQVTCTSYVPHHSSYSALPQKNVPRFQKMPRSKCNRVNLREAPCKKKLRAQPEFCRK